MGFERPVPDARQDVTLLGATLAADVLTVTFTRPLAPCDDFNIPIRKGQPSIIMWAVGEVRGCSRPEGTPTPCPSTPQAGPSRQESAPPRLQRQQHRAALRDMH
jgi:hypothetical protein